GPGPEFVGVAYGPDAGDLVVGDVEGEDGDGGAVVLDDQAGLAVDGAFEDGQRWCLADQAGQVAGDLLGAFDRMQGRGDQAAAVGGDGGVGVEQPDEGGDVLGLPGVLEVADDGGLAGGGSRRGVGGTDAAAAGGGQLAAGGRGAADDAGDLGEGIAEDVVQDKRDAFGGGHRLEHDQERHGDRLVEGDAVGGVGRGAGAAADPLGGFGQRLGDPLADVALAAGAGRAELVEADAAGDRGQPGAGGGDGVARARGQGIPAGVGFLDGVFGFGQGSQQPIGEIDQLPPLADDPQG